MTSANGQTWWLRTPVWPDVGIKSIQIVSKSGEKRFHKSEFLKRDPKAGNIWATFARKYVAETFQKQPNLSTLLRTNDIK